MKSVQGLKVATAVLGRRQTLKYAILGVAGSLAAACSSTSAGAAGSGAGLVKGVPGAGADGSVIGQATKTFLAGHWVMEQPWNSGRDQWPPLDLDVHPDGGWRLQFHGPVPTEVGQEMPGGIASGTWEFNTGELRVHGWGQSSPDPDRYFLGTRISTTVAESMGAVWRRHTPDGDSSAHEGWEAKWDGNASTLTLSNQRGNGLPLRADIVVRRVSAKPAA